MDKITKTYYNLIYESTLYSFDAGIETLPEPFKTYIKNMRDWMIKAKDAVTKEEQIYINSNVNEWRDKLIKTFIKHQNTLDDETSNKINEVLMDLIQTYTNFMGGVNSGYAEAN